MDKDNLIMFPDYNGSGNIKNTGNNNNNKKPVLGSFLKWIIVLIITACITSYITTTLPHHLSPMYTNISIQHIGLDFIQLNQNDKICNIFFNDSVPRVSVFLDNNNDRFIRITDFKVNVVDYAYITEEDFIYRPDIGGLGSLETPIYLKTKIEPYVGTMKTELDQNLNLEYGNSIFAKSDSYIEIASNSSDEFFLTMDTDKQGHYSIEVEFQYEYHGKTYTIKTEIIDYIFLEMNYKDSLLSQ